MRDNKVTILFLGANAAAVCEQNKLLKKKVFIGPLDNEKKSLVLFKGIEWTI